MSFCDDCFKGVTHEGTPKGTWQEIGGINCYVGTPSDVEYPKDKALLFLSDVFGMQLVNNQLLIDDFAANGILTFGVDYLFGDGIPADAMGPDSTFDRDAWRERHGYDRTRAAVDAVIAALKEKGITTFAANGYCFGAVYAVALAIENGIQATIVTHPSRLKVPEDLEKYFSVSKAPFLINSCEVDAAFPIEAQAKADEIFGDGKFAPGYKREYFAGCKHGFAVRGDMSDPNVKAGKEGAFKSTVDWVKKYL
ncbi:alpha/beta-hydrolase [Gymnopus androsaceus JB14]|uniref:Alpha/beta-hydrolase n=1 Tax=Gymnopus androsaceus JB14 TaxID=1447944 RepID=A0A6A4I2G0_9AGAR|nr:alpha/beta-hydrolase [Gymnopus androsaceus JB14]